MNVKIVISVACYNNEDEIITFANQIKRQMSLESLVLLITCNACKNPCDLDIALRDVGIDYHIYDSGTNIGYLNGCLYGIEQYGQNNTFHWGVICNTDLYFPHKDFFQKLVQCTTNPEISCIAPNIIRKSNGHHQNPFATKRPTKKLMNFWRIVYSNAAIFNLYLKGSYIKRAIKNQEVPCVNSQYIYAPHGCIFALDFKSIEFLKKEKPDIFLYGEELFIGEILRENNRKVFYSADIEVIHNESATTSLIDIKKKQKWFKQSIEYLYKRFYCI